MSSADHPLSLQSLCRLSIRRAVGRTHAGAGAGVPHLHLPPHLSSFLCYQRFVMDTGELSCYVLLPCKHPDLCRRVSGLLCCWPHDPTVPGLHRNEVSASPRAPRPRPPHSLGARGPSRSLAQEQCCPSSTDTGPATTATATNTDGEALDAMVNFSCTYNNIYSFIYQNAYLPIDAM